MFLLIVIGIRVEDARGSLTKRAPSPLTSGTRRMLGVNVDHTVCELHPPYACPICRRTRSLDDGPDATLARHPS
jgi:hypothetical protein